MTNAKSPMEKPERPLDNECCGGGACQPCVWDFYFDQLEKWQQQNQEKTNRIRVVDATQSASPDKK